MADISKISVNQTTYDLKDETAREDIANVSFSTNEKVSEVGIDDEPTAGSHNLVESGGVKEELALGAVYDVSAKNPTSGPNSDGKWESLSALLSDANLSTLIPTSVRKGGMSIKFVQSSDNKYVQYRLMADDFSTTEADWQGVDAEPTAGSDNLVKSGGVLVETQKLFLEELVGAVYDVWNTSAGQTHYLLPINGGESVTFDHPGSTTSIYCGFLKSYDIPTSGQTPDFCVGYSGRQVYYKSSTITIPTDCRFFVINNPYGNWELTSLKINGVEVINGVHGALANIGKKIIDTEGDIQTLGGNVQTLGNSLQTLDGETVKDSDLTITSVNLANPSNIDDGYYINNNGNINENADWSLISVPVTAGTEYTFGGFYLGRNGYYAFYNGSIRIGTGVEYIDPNGRQHPVTVTAPENATLLYIDIKTANSPSDAYSNMMINVGETLLDYIPYKEKVTAINNIPLTGTDDVKIKEIEDDIDSLQDDVLELQSQMAGTIEDLVADLPVSDGTGVSVGYAYIDSSTGIVKVKLS